jgi:serine/threonine protein kinase
MSNPLFQAPSPEYLAELLPQYDVELFIAQGGMGAVYKGRQISLDRDIAIKVLPHEVGASEEFRESFISEAKSMARLNHSNLLGVFDYGTVEGMPYIVMEYVEGGSLHEACYNQAVEAMRAVIIVKGICDGLAHAHENGIVHRDIKPSNILLTQKLEPKVADFGLAHAADSDKPGLVMGTPGYTAPEVFQDPNKAGALADIYSVGVILNQLLTGIDPAGSMTPPTQSTGNLRLDAIWRKATNPDPAQRYATVAAMSADLEKWIAAKQKSAQAPAARPPSALGRPAPVQASGGGGSAGKFFLIGVLGVMIVAAYLVLKDRKGEIDATAAGNGTTEAPSPEPEAPAAPVSRPPEVRVPMPEPEPEPVEIVENDDEEESEEAEEPEEMVDVDDEPEPEPEPVASLEPGDPELRERAIGLIGEARGKRDKELADNARILQLDLKSHSRGAESDLVALIERLKEDIVDDRIPVIDAVSGLPDEVADAFKGSLAEEESIDTKHRAELTRIRDAYVTRLKGAADEASDEDLKVRLLAQAGEAEDLDEWIAALSPEPERVVRKSSGGLASGFTGNWDIHTEGRIERWIGHPDGKVEVVDRKWVGKWVIIEDGSLEIHWDGKRPYKLKQVSGEWIGKASFGQDVTMKRGDW